MSVLINRLSEETATSRKCKYEYITHDVTISAGQGHIVRKKYCESKIMWSRSLETTGASICSGLLGNREQDQPESSLLIHEIDGAAADSGIRE